MLQNDNLLKRIGKLVKENQLIEQQLREVTSKYNDLIIRYEQITRESKQTVKETLFDKYSEETLGYVKYDMASILVANFHGFSKTSLHTNREIIDEFDDILLNFDKIITRYNLIKVKTHGDAFICVGGIPQKKNSNPIEVVLAALEMIKFIEDFESKHPIEQRIWDISLSIHTGSIYASNLFNYKQQSEVKGDIVNIAMRMQSSSQPQKVNISFITYELIKDFFNCIFSSKVPVKNYADMEIYEVIDIKEEYIDKKKKKTNPLFNIRLQSLLFNDLQEFVLEKMEREMPKDMHYHSVKHTVDVVTQTELIGLGENINEEEILILKTAALMHDIGHILSYENHEENSCIIARELLNDFNYSTQQIENVCELIMSTKMPPAPKNILEKIICDSDLDYLGRTDFIPVSNCLYRELKEHNKIGSLNEWNKLQLNFISNHQYFTQTARNLREVNKIMQIERIKGLIDED